MGATMIFDTLQYAKKIKSAGFTEQQAEVQAEALAGLAGTIENKFATKDDLKDLATKGDLRELRSEFRSDMKEMEFRMLLKLGGLVVGCTGMLPVLMKLLRV